jgi:hypothetical protein
VGIFSVARFSSALTAVATLRFGLGAHYPRHDLRAPDLHLLSAGPVVGETGEGPAGLIQGAE